MSIRPENLEPAIYTGTLRHRRFTPTQHQFTYSLFMVLLDIDRIPETMRAAQFSSYNRFNWASFHEADHFGDPALSLRERLRIDASAQGLELPDGPIFLLTHLRYLGYCFNPISIFYCYPRSGGEPLLMAEVNSTFGESHNYWLSTDNQLPAENSLRYVCEKQMHVSPFVDMPVNYEFVLTQPSDRLVAHMNTSTRGAEAAPFFDATLTLERQPWTSHNLARALVRQPWMTAKVIGAIHWEALRLYLKGTHVFTKPAPLDSHVSVSPQKEVTKL